jgi:ribonuclease HI
MPGTDEWLYVYSDGGARNNPGPAGAGGQARDEAGTVLVEVCEFLGKATNNVAEYYALILTLEASRGLGYQRVRVRVDSTLVANQVIGAWRIKNQGLKPLVGRVRELLDAYGEVEVKSIPREKNSECDALANKAIDEGILGLKEPLLDTGDMTLF